MQFFRYKSNDLFSSDVVVTHQFLGIILCCNDEYLLLGNKPNINPANLLGTVIIIDICIVTNYYLFLVKIKIYL